MALDEVEAKLTGAIRRALIMPAENVTSIIKRIVEQDYPTEVAQHLLDQLRELANDISYRLGDRAQRIERLGTSLSAFEKRLFEMCRAGRD